MHDFRKLEVWKKSRSLVSDIYIRANQLPKEEVFGLTSQIKRSAVSIPSNIAEGCGRGTNKQLTYHLDIALGSAFELETQILLASDLNYLNTADSEKLVLQIQEIIKMIIGLKKTIKEKVLVLATLI